MPVTAFYEAYQNTAASQRMKEMLAKPYEAVPDAPDPLVPPAAAAHVQAKPLHGTVCHGSQETCWEGFSTT